MLTIACLLRSGGDYRPAHVAFLKAEIEKHLTVPHRFACLSDVDVPCERIPLTVRWPGYWSKIELFRPGLFTGPVFYIDLDSGIVGNIDDLVIDHHFTMLRDFYWPEFPASGVMAWSVDLSAIYHAFVKHGDAYMKAKPERGTQGDQGVIAKHTPVAPDFWQDRFPGRVISYKVHVRKPMDRRETGNGSIPAGASIIAYHGKPRPWQVAA
jgi:hypothetical protein